MNSITDLSRVITSKGYAIKKLILTPKQIDEIRTELTAKPKVPETFQKLATSFEIYRESPTRFYLPRQYAIKKFGPAESNIVPEGTPLPSTVSFTGNAFDYQQNIMNKFFEADCNGLLCVPCGKGKTFMALNIAVRLGRRFLVVVDKEFLMNQWKDEIAAWCKGIRVGIVQGPRIEIDAAQYDCTICMLQTLCSREFPTGFFNEYGLAIFDECHHLGAVYFSRVLQIIQTRCQLGLSATPQREDGLMSVFVAYLGDPVYWEKTREKDTGVRIHAVEYKTNDATYNDVPLDWRGKPVMAKLLNKISEWSPRNKLIAEHLFNYSADHRRQIIVLSDRKEQLNVLEILINSWKRPLQEPWKKQVGFYIGGMKDAALKENAAGAQILLATYSMASDALNIKALNTAVFATSRKNVIQSSGRILRQRISERIVEPTIIDIIDSHQPYQSQWRRRAVYYRSCGYKIEGLTKLPSADDISDSDSDDTETATTSTKVVKKTRKNNLSECAFVEE
jgi:superfamily II DNA or RNA helicase